MGSLFSGSKTTTTNETADTGPSKFQQPFLSTAFDAAQKNYAAQAGTPSYQGETYAGMSADQKATLAKLKAYATGQGLDSANQLSAIGQGLVSNAGKASSTLDQFTALAGTDGTAANIAAASTYADNPYLEGQIDANARDVTRNLSEVTLPGIDRSAAGTGNLNSSRAGVAAGIAQRGAEDRIGDISAQLRGDAYSKGLTLAQADRGQQLDALDRASQGYSNLTGQGIGAIGAGNSAAYNAYNAAAGADAAEQADRQGADTAAKTAWTEADNRNWDLLNKYYGVVGANSWGSSGTSSGKTVEKNKPSLLSSILGAASTAASFF